MPTIGFGTVVGLGASGPSADLRANAEAIDSAGDLIVVGSLAGTANFNPNGAPANRTASGNRDAYVAEFSASGALNWVVTFAGQSTSAVGQVSAVAVDGSGNIEVAGSFSGTVKFGTTTLAAPSRTDAFVAKLSGSGAVVWAVQTTGATNKVDAVSALAPDGSGGAYIAGSYMGTMTAGSTALTAVGQSEAWAAHVDSTGSIAWAKSTSGSPGSVAGMNGLAVDPSGRLVMAGFFAGSVNFNPSGSTVLVGAGSYDVATWVLNADGSLAWARDFGGSNYDQADAVAVDKAGNVYVTGAFSGTVDFNPSGPALPLTAQGIYDVFVLKLTPAGATAWADSFAGSNGPAMGDGIGVDPSGNVDVAGWFAGTLDFDPGTGTDLIASRGSQDVFVAMLDSSGSFVAATTGGGFGTDTAFGLAINASGTIAVAGVYNGPTTAPPGPTTFGSTDLATIGTADIFVASVTPSGPTIAAPSAPTLEASSDSGSSSSDGLTDVTSPTFDVTVASAGFTVQLLRDGSVVASRVGPGPITDPGPVPDGAHVYSAQQVDTSGNTGALSSTTTITVDTALPATPSAPTLVAADDSGTLGDGLTNVTMPRLTGIADPGTTVRLYAGAILIGTSTGGTFTIAPTAALADGTYSLTVTATDAAGNTSAASRALTLTIDTTPPAAPPAPTLLSADDSGTVGDGLTDINRPRLTGTAEAGATVRLYAGATLIGTGTSAGGTYTIQVASILPDGTYAITAVATDASGNAGAAGGAFALTIDTTPPAAPPAPGLLAADDSGTVGDGLTNVSRPRLTGTAEAGSVVRVWINGAVVGSGTASGGVYTILLSSSLADGTYSMTATATDAAGNTSASGAAFVLTIDTVAPAAPALGLLAADDSGALGDGITNVSRPRMTGSAEPGSTVALFLGGSPVGTGVATGGAFTILLTAALPEGSSTITATATDAAGNAGAPASFAVTVDTASPAAPAGLGLLAADDSGTVGDGITDVSKPRLTGSAEPGATVRLYSGATLIGTATAAGGSYTITPTTVLADGNYPLTATATDAAGNTSTPGLPFLLTIDTRTSASPGAPGLLAADDSGIVGDGLTGVNEPRLTGSAEPGATVRLYAGAAMIGTATASGGTYTIAPTTALADGTYAITAVATDAAGNTSGSSPSFSLTIDTTPPAAPTAPALLAADDSDTVGDGITAVNRPRLSGTAESGTTVRLYAGAALIGTGTATGGSYTIQATSILPDGTYAITAVATDAAGNTGAAGAAFSLTIDTTAPAAPPAPGLLAVDDSGTVGDGLTNVSRPRLTGTAESGAVVRLYAGGNLVGTGTAAGGTYTILLDAALAYGVSSITATATDAAGNTSASGAAFSLTIDTIAPTTPPKPGLLAADDSGALGDGITDVSKPRLTGTAEAGATVRLYAGATLIGTATAAGGSYTIQPTSNLADGTYSVTATATDAAGNTSAMGGSFALTVDTVAPAAPSLGLLAADDSGTVGDGLTNVSRPRLTGTAESGSTVTLFLLGSPVGVGTATGGSFTILLTAALPEGSSTITAMATDAAGNAGAPASFAVTVDTASPGAPAGLDLLAADDSGTVGDGLTNVNAPRLTGTAESGSTVRLFAGGKLLGTGMASGGSYTIAPTTALADGTYSVTATATDAAGNTSTAGAPFSLTIDTHAPASPPASGLLAADDSGTVGDGLTDVNEPRLTGSAESGSTVRLYAGATLIGSGIDVGGSYTILLNAALVDGSYSVTAIATDAAGNASGSSPSFSLTIDTTPPAAPTAPALLAADDSGSVGDGLTNVNKPRLTGTAESGATIRLFAGGKLLGSGTAVGGTYTIAPTTALADGTYSVTATATDAAGNASGAGGAFALTIDTTPPAAPAPPSLLAADDSGAVGDGITNVNKPRLTGSAESGAIVRLYAGATPIGSATAVGGTYTIALTTALADGTYAITAVATDASGNAGAAGGAFVLTIDTAPPAAPAAPGLLAADDSGALGDGITDVSRPHLTGVVEAGSVVRVWINGAVVGSGTASGGVYSILLNAALADGTYAVTASATDASGNAGASGGAFALTIDTTSPAAPPKPGLLAADDSGTVGDGITNVGKPRLTGTAEAGVTVRLYAGATLIGTATATGGSYTIAPATALSDGTYAITATATDASGNTGATGAAFSLTIDTKAPASPPAPALLAADDSGTVGDGTTNVSRPRLTGSAESGSTVRLYAGGGLVGTGTAAGGTYTILLSAALADGVSSITATATDASGNTSPAGGAFALTIDTTSPAAPTLGLLAADDSGTVGDGITNVSAPRMTGTAESGATVRLTINGRLVGSGTSVGGHYTIAIAPPLADGIVVVTASATDAAGNAGVSTSFTVTVDTSRPAAPPAPRLLAADDSGTVGDGITNVSKPRLIGKAEAGSVVGLYAGGKLLGTATATGGSYTIAISPALTNGTYSVTAIATDVAGNVGAPSPAFLLTIAASVPAAPTLALLAADDTGAKGDGVTGVLAPRISGTAAPGNLVQLLGSGGRVLASVTAAADGSYTLATPFGLAGTWAYRVRAVDAAGNVGATSAALSIRRLAVAGDYDGDGKADAITYNATTGQWTIRSSASGAITQVSWGDPGRSVPVPADYDGDGKTDLAVFIPATEDWYILNSASGTTAHYNFGQAGDIPVPGDYTGVGRAEPTLYRPSTGQWFVLNPDSGQFIVWNFGVPNLMLPEPADYAGFGRADPTVFEPSTGDWYSINTTNYAEVHTYFGGAGVAPVPADYDGDGKADIAVYWPAAAQWYILQSSTGTKQVVTFGLANVDQPVPLDYTGDGRADLAVYRPSTSTFIVLPKVGGASQSMAVGKAGADEAAKVPWTYLYYDMHHLPALNAAAAPAVAEPAPAATPAAPTPSPAPAPTPAPSIAARTAVASTSGKGTPVPQPIKWRRWTPSGE